MTGPCGKGSRGCLEGGKESYQCRMLSGQFCDQVATSCWISHVLLVQHVHDSAQQDFCPFHLAHGSGEGSGGLKQIKSEKPVTFGRLAIQAVEEVRHLT